MTDDEFDIFLRRANSELRQKQECLMATFGLGNFSRWWFDQETAQLQFFDVEDKLKVSADVVDIGSFKQETWKWAWANETVIPSLRRRAEPLKELERITGMTVFTRADLIPIDEGMAWELAALSVMHLRSLGCYRAPHSDGLWSFLAIESIRSEAV
jgi:hypothetical protein